MKYTFLITLYFSFSICYGQKGTINGSITDASGKALANGHVYLEKAKYGSVSNDNGRFTIANVPTGKHVIRFSAVGYQTKSDTVEVKSDETTEVNFLAEEKVELLREVTISGIKSIT